MSLLVFGLVAAAALMHAAWNVLLKTAGDPLRTSARAVATGTVVAVPLAGAAWLATGRPPIPAEALVLVVVSGIGETVYFVFLSAAYRRGDISLVYPIARGSAPLLAVASGTLILGERLGPLGAVGVAALLAGILAIRRPWEALLGRIRGPRLPGTVDTTVDPAADRRRREAVALALATGVMIATYSSIDRVGTRLVAPWLYVTLLWVVTSAGLLGWVRLMDIVRLAPVGAARPALAATPGDLVDETPDAPEGTSGGVPGRSALIGLLLLGAYLLVLVSFTLAPLTAVAPLRESAVVVASGWGALRLGEASGRRDAAWRIGGAALIVVGAVLLALER